MPDDALTAEKFSVWHCSSLHLSCILEPLKQEKYQSGAINVMWSWDDENSCVIKQIFTEHEKSSSWACHVRT